MGFGFRVNKITPTVEAHVYHSAAPNGGGLLSHHAASGVSRDYIRYRTSLATSSVSTISCPGETWFPGLRMHKVIV